MKWVRLACFFVLFSNYTFAQNKNYQITFTSGDTISQVSMERVEGDSVEVLRDGQSQWLKIDSIVEIRQVKKMDLWPTTWIAALGGGVIGGVIGKAAYKPESSTGYFNFDFTGLNIVAGAVAGVLIGGALGITYEAIEGADEVYDLSDKTLEQKIDRIQFIISKVKNN